MRVAIPVTEGRVERVCDCAAMLMVIDLRGPTRAEYFETRIGGRSLKDRARELVAMRIDALLCNEISHALESLIRAQGIEVHTRLSGSVDRVLCLFVDRRYRAAGLSRQAPPVLVPVA